MSFAVGCQVVITCVHRRSWAQASPASTPPIPVAPSSWSRRPHGARRRRRARWERWESASRGEPRLCGNISPCLLSPLRPLPRHYLHLLPPPSTLRSARAWARRVWELLWTDPRPRTPSPTSCPGAGWRRGCGPPMAMPPPLGLPLSPAHLYYRLPRRCHLHATTPEGRSAWLGRLPV